MMTLTSEAERLISEDERLIISQETINRYAYSYIHTRSYSTQQMREKLAQTVNKLLQTKQTQYKPIASEELNAMIEHAIALCLDYQFLDDAQFLKTRIEGLQSKGKGYYAILSDLMAKGFSKEEITIELSHSKNSSDQYPLRVLEKKFITKQLDLKLTKDRARCYRFLHSRGFRSDEINQAITAFELLLTENGEETNG